MLIVRDNNDEEIGVHIDFDEDGRIFGIEVMDKALLPGRVKSLHFSHLWSSKEFTLFTSHLLLFLMRLVGIAPTTCSTKSQADAAL
jgi:hypothetical protein